MQKYSVNLAEDAENDIAELMAFYEELVDDDRFEVIAVRAYHQMQNPMQYQESVRQRIRKFRG